MSNPAAALAGFGVETTEKDAKEVVDEHRLQGLILVAAHILEGGSRRKGGHGVVHTLKPC